jgi:RimJ/RimL family protein N-acetyltransferase
VFKASFWDSAAQGNGALLITDKATGEVIGSSRFYDWKPDSGEVVIGFTFLVRRRWGDGTNRELKQLMLAHAFKRAMRVWFHIGRDNLRSRQAIEKIGATFSHEITAGLNGVTAHYRLDAPRER